jgi:rRNA pseudouridine-1189 N-methylase Emg1 (Nep1/Mra1 family)
MRPAELVEKAQGGDLNLIIGAFASGDFSAAWKQAVPETASIWKEPLNAWAVAAELVAAYRARWGP